MSTLFKRLVTTLEVLPALISDASSLEVSLSTRQEAVASLRRLFLEHDVESKKLFDKANETNPDKKVLAIS